MKNKEFKRKNPQVLPGTSHLWWLRVGQTEGETVSQDEDINKTVYELSDHCTDVCLSIKYLHTHMHLTPDLYSSNFSTLPFVIVKCALCSV